ncbi:Variant-specific surface protein [Giardia duodenalis]|uniref:Variant-specific surface protein n=1 Tax=Giardia intestinalis TaxID=5741 RepID=V6TTC9_GIAIN|nr:Variant-specific surface protein [Giardia intestinalis]
MCEMVGTTEICTQCKTGGNVPINGTCTAKTDDTDKCKKAGGSPVDTNDKVCGQCGAGYLLHKGGCYKIGQAPGSLICADANSVTGDCETCQAGYFKNPASTTTNDKESCIACGDVTGADNYKGRDKCATCDSSKLPVSGGGTITCTTCIDGYFADNNGAECKACTDPCATCTASGTDKCTSCKDASDKQYFKKGESNDGTGTCVSEETCKTDSTYFPTTDKTSQKKICTLCSDASNGGVADCKTCSKSEETVTCSACTAEGKKPNTAGAKCVDCAAAGCAKCSDEGVCVECDSSKYLTPTAQCVDKCDKLGGYYADGQRVCQPCDPSCAACVGANANQCSACPAGKVLKYTDDTKLNEGGSCVDECKTGANGCADCGATIGGSKYCSRCSTSSEYPVNGVCKASTARANECKTPDNKGGCTTCATGYFLLENGCYKTDRQPGSQVCTAADTTGKCTQCANGMTITGNSGVCPSCDPSCKTCTKQSDPNACLACFSGYYLSGTKCVKCDTDDSNIKGVPNCISCLAPTSPNALTPVTCYVTQTPTVDPTDPSVNKGGLSSGATAGISVAVIVVVGGLVGFLCWWFICRGKA